MDIIKFITGRYDKIDYILKSIKIIGTEDALFYKDSNFLNTITEVYNQYNYYDLRPTDIVLDIGACIGAFSLKVNNKVFHVHSIEPVMTKQLEKNISLNNANNITMHEYALGDGNHVTINWQGNIKIVKSYSLSDIISMCGGHIDFLKCDCEGGEWYIKPNEIKDIRRIEMEIHNVDINHPLSYFENILDDNGFIYNISSLSDDLFLVSAKKKEKENNTELKINLFSARNLVHNRIKQLPGFIGININAKVGNGGILVIYVKDKKAKESLHKICGDMQYGYYVEYNIQEGLKFS